MASNNVSWQLAQPKGSQASTTVVDTTLSPNSRELEDSEVIDVTELAPEVHGIMQDIKSVLGPDHMSPSLVSDEKPPLEQVRASTSQSSLSMNIPCP
jgi:hypothetical protein